jgi:DNA-binding PucR family transcriptional regulator
VVSVEQLGVYRLLLQTGQPQQLSDFSRRLLDPLRDYDRRHDIGLMDTLKAFIANECSIARTAEELGVHRHTLGYRLKRVEEITKLDLRGIDSLIELRLALMVNGLLGA